MLVFDQVNIVCANPEASIAFYERLCVNISGGVTIRMATGVHHVGTVSGSTEKPAKFDLDSEDFARLWNSGWSERTDLAGRVVVGFSVETRERVDALYEDMSSEGFAGLQAPCDAFWGSRFAIIEDPDGVAVGIASPVSIDRRSAPPQV